MVMLGQNKTREERTLGMGMIKHKYENITIMFGVNISRIYIQIFIINSI